MSDIHSDLKPLYANLKRLSVGSFLQSTEFNLFTIENNFDDDWKHYTDEACDGNVVMLQGYSNNEKYEKGLLFLLSNRYSSLFKNFSDFLLSILIEFAKWNETRIDFTQLTKNLKELDFERETIYDFVNDIRSIQKGKPLSIEKKDKLVKNKPLDKSKVFIVHGHDNGIKNEVARLIGQLKLTPIILHEQVNSGNTIIEKIEEHSNVGFGIVLYTPCDFGGKNDLAKIEKPRARQNVVFEHGYLIGKIGRKNVCALVSGEVETPNDISGVVYISINNGAWKLDIAKELKNSGYQVDFNLL